MTGPSLGVRFYRRILWLYPRWFREAYGEDMTGLLIDQLANEGAWRVYGRVVLDLSLTIPNRHLETHLKRSSPSVLPLFFVCCAAAALLLLGVGGTSPVLGLLFAVPIMALALAGAAWWRSRPYHEPRPASAAWWRWLAAGAGVIALMAGVTTATGELPEGAWFFAMLAFISGLGMLVMGLALGVARLASGHQVRHSG